MPSRPVLLLAMLAASPVVAPRAHAEQKQSQSGLGLRLRVLAHCQPDSHAASCPPGPQVDSAAHPAPPQVRALTPPSPQQAALARGLVFSTQAF